MNQETLSIIIQFITLGGVIFAIFKFFRDPDIKADKAIEILKEQNKLEKQISLQALKTIQNDMHELSAEVNEHRRKIEDLCICIAKLETIINERIPKKDNSGD